jgi:hypothetical protein
MIQMVLHWVTAVVVASCLGSQAAQNKIDVVLGGVDQPTPWWNFRKTSPPRAAFR